MKKLALIAIAIAGLAACNKNPKEITIAETENLTKYKEELQSALTVDEKKILARYFFQNGMNVNQSFTIQQAIDHQLNVEKQREAEIEKRRETISNGIQDLNSRYNLAFVSFQDKGEEKYLPAKVVLKLTNNTGKTIKAIQPKVQFVLNDQIVYTDTSFTTEEFNPPLENGQSRDFTAKIYGHSTEGQAIIAALANRQNVAYGFIGLEAVFTDSTVEKIDYSRQ